MASHPLVIVTRPWSFPAAVVPVLLTAAIVHRSGEPWSGLELLRALVLGLLVQAASNTGNTYWDFVNGADSANVNCGADSDKVLKHKGVLVEGKTTPQAVLALTALLYAASACLMADRLLGSGRLAGVYACGVALSHFYTADPVRLKYYALGDLAIFVAFGPLLTLCTAMLISPGAVDKGVAGEVMLLCVPCSLVCECILHANNSRDIGEDRRNGLTTIATLLGHDASRALFVALIAGAYAIVAAFAVHRGTYSLLLVLLSAPLAADVVSRFSRDANRIADLPKRVAQLYIVFGLLLMGGVLLS